MRKVVMDFSKMSSRGTSRQFNTGFIRFYGQRGDHLEAFPPYPGMTLIDRDQQGIPSITQRDCDVVEKRPTFILSNDDIYNLGHYINDVIGIWAMTILSNRSSQDSLMINMDGLRSGGPAGGGSHRLMIPGQPDTHGPYSPSYYHLWFDEVKKAVDYGQQKVCFEELHIFPLPGVPWFWNDWGRINECSMVAASPLYQSFNLFLRQHIMDHYGSGSSSSGSSSGSSGLQSLSNPPEDVIHIVIEVRKINPAKRAATATGRFIRNLSMLINTLQQIPNVKVTAQDFAQLSFIDQIKLAHTASIFVSMHGAGTTHIFHMAIGQKHCCGLIELFPDKSIDLYTAQGYGNLARMLGFHHVRLVADSGATTASGTAVDVQAIKQLAVTLIDKIQLRPTCLHNVIDTR
jgi:hypothetical protein